MGYTPCDLLQYSVFAEIPSPADSFSIHITLKHSTTVFKTMHMLSLLDQGTSIYAYASMQMEYFLWDLLWAKFLSFCIEDFFPALPSNSKSDCKIEYINHFFLLPLNHLANPKKGLNTACSNRHKLFFFSVANICLGSPSTFGIILMWYNPIHFWSLPPLSSFAILLPLKKVFKWKAH